MLPNPKVKAPTIEATLASDELVLPIGQYVGSIRDVHRAGRIETLTDDAFLLWTLAHGPIDPILAARLPWSYAELVRYAELAGLIDAADAAAALLRRGLLAAISCDGAVAVDFAQRHRAVPLLLGLGNTGAEPKVFGMGVAGKVLARVDEPTYNVWCMSTVVDNLWSACAAVAPQGAAERVLAGFLAAFHRLASVNALYLDAAKR